MENDPYAVYFISHEMLEWITPHPEDVRARLAQDIKNIFGSLPDHVVYASCDLETEDLGKRLLDMGYDCRTKTLFLMAAKTTKGSISRE
jgi:O-methyltransferase involved in polyketide biosynthesis